MRVFQFNLQEKIGGGEIYTAFLCRALAELGVSTTLFCNSRNHSWSSLNLPEGTEFVPLDQVLEAQHFLPEAGQWLLSHGSLPKEMALACKRRHLLTGICHMPPQGRSIGAFDEYHQVFGVSGYVVSGLREKGVHTWQEPLYGVADIFRGGDANSSGSASIRQSSVYDWDMRKFRERCLSYLEPLYELIAERPLLERRDGLTLGIVSRLATIKQFPLLFSKLVPVLQLFPQVNVEIFGSGGYTMVRDLRAVMLPIADRVRYWGHQENVAAVYGRIDYLLSGLPEKEALGLNILEAQAAGVPVIAVDAPPFNETVLHGQSGFLYTDPRLDEAASFKVLLETLLGRNERFHPQMLQEHLNKFSLPAFGERLKPIVEWVKKTQSGMAASQ